MYGIKRKRECLCNRLSNTIGGLGDCETLLLARVAVAERYSVFKLWGLTDGIKVYRDAEGRTDFVLPAVPLADVAIVIPRNLRNFFFKVPVDFARLINQLWFIAKQWKHSNLYRGHTRMKTQDNTLLAIHLVFAIHIGKNCENRTINADRCLNNVGNISLLSLLVVVRHINAGKFLMLG